MRSWEIEKWEVGIIRFADFGLKECGTEDIFTLF